MCSISALPSMVAINYIVVMEHLKFGYCCWSTECLIYYIKFQSKQPHGGYHILQNQDQSRSTISTSLYFNSMNGKECVYVCVCVSKVMHVLENVNDN
jgi:hypothetical protein